MISFIIYWYLTGFIACLFSIAIDYINNKDNTFTIGDLLLLIFLPIFGPILIIIFSVILLYEYNKEITEAINKVLAYKIIGKDE